MMGIYSHRTIKKKIPLTKLSKKIQRLVKIYGSVKLEVYNSGRRTNPYGMRYLKANGDCDIHYVEDFKSGFSGRSRQSCCFFDDYSRYTNDNGDTRVFKNLSDTLRAMQRHDGRSYNIKYIHVDGRKIKC